MGSRSQMVDEIREKYGLRSSEVLSAMLQVARDAFVDGKYKQIAYSDGPVPIGYGQTMSQPYTVAFMTHLLIEKRDTRDEKILEVGTGSGYQAAVLSKLVGEVYTVEIIPELAKKAKRTLKKLGYKNVHVHAGSGEWGWEEHAPYDGILVTAGIEDEVPAALFDQLKDGGVLVAPVGKGYDKRMIRYRKVKDRKIKKHKFGIFHFVPFVKEKVRS